MLESFAAIIPAEPRILILGSMPSTRSLHQGQYYAHPYNAFWPILAAVFCPRDLSLDSQVYSTPVDSPQIYALGRHHEVAFARKRALLEATNIALWDVLAACERRNSADSSIRAAVFNPIPQLLQEHPSIERILCNGQKSSSLLRQKIVPQIYAQKPGIYTLPSTSPAYAAMPFTQKLELWQQALTSVPT